MCPKKDRLAGSDSIANKLAQSWRDQLPLGFYKKTNSQQGYMPLGIHFHKETWSRLNNRETQKNLKLKESKN